MKDKVYNMIKSEYIKKINTKKGQGKERQERWRHGTDVLLL